ncbi:MAG: TauD/TfdA dioxygenase family protein [Angustibacter sp.]
MSMQFAPQQKFGVVGRGFTPSAGDDVIEEILSRVYQNKIVLLKDVNLDEAGLIAFGARMGEIEPYHEKMYHHPEHPEIFVSSNVVHVGEQVGVPKTGKFWHADYQFMPRPFGITIVNPKVVPSQNRGTYFIDMGRAWADLDADLQSTVASARSLHSVRAFQDVADDSQHLVLPGSLVTAVCLHVTRCALDGCSSGMSGCAIEPRSGSAPPRVVPSPLPDRLGEGLLGEVVGEIRADAAVQVPVQPRVVLVERSGELLDVRQVCHMSLQREGTACPGDWSPVLRRPPATSSRQIGD